VKLWRGRGVSCCFEIWHKIQAEEAEWNCERIMIFGCKVNWLHAKVHVGCTFPIRGLGSNVFDLILFVS
jgi:hypothetical protein